MVYWNYWSTSLFDNSFQHSDFLTTTHPPSLYYKGLLNFKYWKLIHILKMVMKFYMLKTSFGNMILNIIRKMPTHTEPFEVQWGYDCWGFYPILIHAQMTSSFCRSGGSVYSECKCHIIWEEADRIHRLVITWRYLMPNVISGTSFIFDNG